MKQDQQNVPGSKKWTTAKKIQGALIIITQTILICLLVFELFGKKTYTVNYIHIVYPSIFVAYLFASVVGFILELFNESKLWKIVQIGYLFLAGLGGTLVLYQRGYVMSPLSLEKNSN